MPPLPYIGVTGFMTPEEVWQVLEAVPLSAHRKLMVGVLASSKTMRGIPNKYPHRYPRPEKIAEIFVDHPLALNLIHFNTKEPKQLLDQMIEATKLGGPNFHGFQLNIKWPWPNPHILRSYKEQCPGKILVLQAGDSVLEVCEHKPSMLTAFIRGNYDCGLCDYLLIDPSGGYGKPFDPHEGFAYLDFLNDMSKKGVLRDMLFGIAGGLYSKTLKILKPIAKAFPETSIDAEGKLRDVDDDLIIEESKQYVAGAFQMFDAI